MRPALYGLLAASSLLGLLIINTLCQHSSYAQIFLGVIIILFEIAIPFEIIKWQNIRPKDFNIYAHNIDTIIDLLLPPYWVKKVSPHFKDIGKELLFFLKISIITLVPYIFFYYLYFQIFAWIEGQKLIISVNFPPQIFYEVITQIFVVALPEELFYRGFLQSALLKEWPNKKFIAGVPVGKAIILTNSIFAVGHLVGTWSPTRLLTFFPGLLFSYLVYKNNSLLSAILFHAACNILGQILYASLFLQ